ncbi:glycosyltransferase [Campylobacter ureolyticus]|uniref:glycosyltransferase family 2 protein n=1 Tax=Campylobacter ureolyticus TaxID=827 RepID=UPI0022B4B93C|nr:glycosyltransferase [Campylobacter ureolyticus]MCZ6173750.1 glycosyltransferase [Campylobacter ureolyticus]MCZ6186317.1 glycosyltransferase [Campylobacter ureolyticus]
MQNNPLISIVVPVYNVEKYLKKCIQSIIEQTYKNLEIILVDDGSNDNSGKICDEFAQKDNRIKVIHKINGGQADARNKALDIMNGEWVSFVDSDDFVDKFHIENLYFQAVRNNSDICVCGFKIVNEDYKTIRSIKVKFNDSLNGNLAFKYSLNSKIDPSLWNKIFKSSLFDNTRFVKGIYYEDRELIHRIFYKADRVSFLDSESYFYLERVGSTMNHINKKKIDDRFVMISLVKDFLEKEAFLEKYQKDFIICYLLNVYMSASFQIARCSRDYKNDIRYLFSKSDKELFSFKNIFLLFNIDIKKMIALFILKINSNLFKYLVDKI